MSISKPSSETAPSWNFDKSYEIAKDTIRVMRRPIELIGGEFICELAPFVSERCAVVIRDFSNNTSTTIPGHLLPEWKDDGVSLSIVVRHADKNETIQLSFPRPCTKKNLTVWRLNDTLQAVQLSLASDSIELIIQAGGVDLKKIIASNTSDWNGNFTGSILAFDKYSVKVLED